MDDPELAEVFAAPDPEAAIRRHLAKYMDDLRARAAEPGHGGWRPGQPLVLLLAGYNGAGNIGADIRVAEMIRQIRAVLTPQRVEIRLVTIDEQLEWALFPNIRPEPITTYFPRALAELVATSDGTVACEGSMFKSTFSDTLSAMMAGALGIAVAGGKPAVGMGAEADRMSDDLARFVAEVARGAVVFCRSAASERLVAGLGLDARPGADTAWSFEAAPADHARTRLTSLGWDGKQPVTVVSPVDAFWWPVRLEPARLLRLQQSGELDDRHYGAGFFHADGRDVRARTSAFVEALAGALNVHRQDTGAFIVVVAMDRVDQLVASALTERLDSAPPILASGEIGATELVAVLRAADLLVSSRYHAIVTALPAGVAAVGVSMDERIGNLLDESGQSERLVPADSPDLIDQLIQTIRKALDDRPAIAAAARALAARELGRQAQMGRAFAALLAERLPGLEIAGASDDPTYGLPPLSPTLIKLLTEAGPAR